MPRYALVYLFPMNEQSPASARIIDGFVDSAPYIMQTWLDPALIEGASTYGRHNNQAIAFYYFNNDSSGITYRAERKEYMTIDRTK